MKMFKKIISFTQIIINPSKNIYSVKFVNLRQFGASHYKTSNFPSTDISSNWHLSYSELLEKIKKDGVECLEEKYIPITDGKEKMLEDNINHFVDYRNVTTKAGNGGDGNISFLRYLCNDRAGPGGGDGGNGGHVIFQADKNIKSLNHLETRIMAKNGQDGGAKECDGKNANHLIIKIPIGTLFKKGGKVISHLDEEGGMFIAARGGAGGKGNIFFKCNEHKAPTVAEYGGVGENIKYDVELRIMADIGLIGFPNAGKSTLLRAISRARPKVAAYPFTTLNPYVGMVKFEDLHQMSVADIPGLIEGAHKNKGLGFSFLRHIERCSCLLYVIDASYEDPFSQLTILKKELELYSERLSKRPHAIVANKMDLPQSMKNFLELKQQANLPVIPISGEKELNLIPLLALMRLLSEVRN